MRLARLLPLMMSFALAVPSLSHAADQYVPLQQRMSPEEFKATGLDKLSPDELKNLDAWLSGHGKVVTKVVDEAGKPVFYPTSEKAAPVQGRVQGEFSGFSGHGEFTLDNGQVWKQADNTRIACLTSNNPKVEIKRSLFGNWMMSVDGCNDTTSVTRVR
ncbi:hypothetical protein ACXU4B_13375 [Dyella soli]|uniref:Uncharacterized protein n=1 Tax=Dyella soli TaxID=522319 RepID=A0A4R0YKR5_9GAMM|nr:hypothetical protein [Dyella soli]TCI06875.1 hypothetical protein EZM97_30065 [Dyella soli]